MEACCWFKRISCGIGVIEQPAGSRPARVIVGAPFGSDVLNTAAAAVQVQALTALGLGGIIPATDNTPTAQV
jgi:hypothetical protein